MGAMTEKMKPDGLPFYAICSWGKPQRLKAGRTGMGSGQFRGLPRLRSWIYCGSDGVPWHDPPRNYRDGLEDLLMRKSYGKGGKVDVPKDLMKSMTEYTLDPARSSVGATRWLMKSRHEIHVTLCARRRVNRLSMTAELN